MATCPTVPGPRRRRGLGVMAASWALVWDRRQLGSGGGSTFLHGGVYRPLLKVVALPHLEWRMQPLALHAVVVASPGGGAEDWRPAAHSLLQRSSWSQLGQSPRSIQSSLESLLSGYVTQVSRTSLPSR